MSNFSLRQAYQSCITVLQEMVSGTPQPATLKATPFNGFGALKQLLLPLNDMSSWTPDDLRYKDEVNTIHHLLRTWNHDHYERNLASIRNSILTSFYTPPHLIEAIVRPLALLNESPKKILDPSAGTGNFISPLLERFPHAEITVIEKEIVTANILKTSYPHIATVHSGFEDFKNQQFDLITSNIPFGNVSVYDAHMFKEAVPTKIKSSTRIHNYFFVKALDNLNDRGILAFITTAAVMDTPGNTAIRQYLMQHADLLAAVRLPNTAFQHAGTSPVTDIIVLRRHANKKSRSSTEQQFIESKKIVWQGPETNIELNLNSLFTTQPELVLGNIQAGGQYHGDTLTVIPRENQTQQELAVLVQKQIQEALHKSNQLTQGQRNPIQSQSSPSDKTITDLPAAAQQLKHGNLFIMNAIVYQLDTASMTKKMVPLPFVKNIGHVASFMAIRDSLQNLTTAESSNDQQAMDKFRKQLNDCYDVFAFQYGPLHLASNKKLCLLDSDGITMLALETKRAEAYSKADIFFNQINNAKSERAKPASLKDALLISLNESNKVDVNLITKLMNKPAQEVVRNGLDQELWFAEWVDNRFHLVTKDEFLSGNIMKKIADWNTSHSPTGSAWDGVLTEEDKERHLARLHDAKPLFLKRELIEINLGERWIPLPIYKDFATHLFKQEVRMEYLESTDQYLIVLKGPSNEDDITYAATTHEGKIPGTKILEYAMADTMPQLKIRVPFSEPPRYQPDDEGMKNVEMKIQTVKTEFENFLNANAAISTQIEERYSEQINNAVRRNYDGSHLQLPGLSHFKPRAHQKDAIWMLLQQDGGIIDHKVGAGKTLVMVAAAMEMKRLGIARKPLIVCMKANAADIANDFIRAYPKAKILAPEARRDFTVAKRKELFARIATNDWDAVILTHEMFQAIPQSNAMKMRILEQELRNLQDDLNIVSTNRSLSKRVLKGLENRKQNLQVKLKLTEAAIKRDANVIDFDKMNFDHLFVDESQAFKNLHFTTRHQSVAGLGDPIGSQRALNLELAIRTVQEKKGADKGTTFLSGTTISNSLVELYLLFKYLRPEKLQELQINSFDAWAKMYARKSATYEFTITNELKMKERYREFIKVPELARFYAEIAHIVTDKNLPIDKPEPRNIVVDMEPTKAQQQFTTQLIQFTKTKNGAHINMNLSKEEQSAFMLLATNLARKMSIDMRLIDATKYSLEPDSKLTKLCQNVADGYYASMPYKGTQLIFSDVGTPDGKGFNVYAEIKRILVTQHQLPAHQIQLIHDHEARTKKTSLFTDVNAGNVRVLIGSTRKLGTGVNVQQRIIAMHHLDIPWKPADFEQRIGRGARQGNEVAKQYQKNEVMNYVYAVNRTLDAYQFNLLANKQRFISQIRNNSIDQRKIDEGAFDQDTGMNFSEYVALLSGNTDLLAKVKLEKQLMDLERTYQSFLKQKAEASHQIAILNRDVELKSTTLTKLHTDAQTIKQNDPEMIPPSMHGKSFTDKKEFGMMLLDEVQRIQKVKTKEPVHLASWLSFHLRYDASQTKVSVVGPSGLSYHYAEGKLNDNPALAGRYIIDTVKRIPKIIDNTMEHIATNQKRIQAYQNELTKEFPEAARILQLKTEIVHLETKIQNEYSSQPPTAEAKEQKSTYARQHRPHHR